MQKFEIKNLHVNLDEKPIIKGLDLVLQEGEVHVIMGPNGVGKSTLAKVIASHPHFHVKSGEILFNEKNILQLSADQRAQLGIFSGFQYPVEIPGIRNESVCFAACNQLRKAKQQQLFSDKEFREFIKEKMKLVELNESFLSRNMNEGFSGGEKKRNEILQLLLLDPKIAILDETDSGLDIDALKVVATGINEWKSEKKILLIITHYQRFLDFIMPDFVHVMVDGKIIKTKGAELAKELEKTGYDELIQEFERKLDDKNI